MRLLLFVSLLLSPLIVRAETPEWYHLNCHLLKVAFTGGESVYATGTNGVLLRSMNKGISWKQIPTLLSDSLIGIAFADPLHGTCVGQGGIILSTIDGGLSWYLQKSSTKFTLRSVAFRENIGVIVGDGGTILRSEDGGKTWLIVKVSAKQNFFVVVFAPDGAVLVGASGGILHRSTDFGITWVGMDSILVTNLHIISDISVSAEGTIFAFATQAGTGSLVTSQDNGKTWSEPKSIPGLTNAISFPNNDAGFIAGDTPQFQITKDEGKSITPQNGIDFALYSTSILNSISFIERSIGIAVGDAKAIYRTTDSGEHWELISWLPSFRQSYKSVQFITEDTGFVGSGSRGLVYHTENGGATWLPPRINVIPVVYNGSAVYGIYFYDSQTGVAFPDAAFLARRTTNGGKTYSEQYMSYLNFPQIHSLSPDFTLMTSSNVYSSPLLYKTIMHLSTDKGLTWTVTKDMDSVLMGDISLISKDIFYANGTPQTTNRFTIFKTKNGGQTFDTVARPSLVKRGSTYFFDENSGFLFGQDAFSQSIMFRTEDGCKSWILVDSARFSSGYSRITFADRLHGYMSNVDGQIIATEDGGITWRTTLTPVSTSNHTENILGLSAIGADVAYSVGGWDSGIILKKLPKSLLSSVDNPTISVGTAPSVWLSSPRPIPTIGMVQIDAIWVKNLDISTIKVKLFSMLGIELRDITEALHPSASANSGIIEFDGSILQTGIYYIEISGGGYRKSVPIIIAR